MLKPPDPPRPSSRPLNAPTPLSGPSMWSAAGDARTAAFAGENTNIEGTYPLPNAETVGFKNQRPNDLPIDNGGHATPDNPELC